MGRQDLTFWKGGIFYIGGMVFKRCGIVLAAIKWRQRHSNFGGKVNLPPQPWSQETMCNPLVVSRVNCVIIKLSSRESNPVVNFVKEIWIHRYSFVIEILTKDCQLYCTVKVLECTIRIGFSLFCRFLRKDETFGFVSLKCSHSNLNWWPLFSWPGLIKKHGPCFFVQWLYRGIWKRLCLVAKHMVHLVTISLREFSW